MNSIGLSVLHGLFLRIQRVRLMAIAYRQTEKRVSFLLSFNNAELTLQFG